MTVFPCLMATTPALSPGESESPDEARPEYFAGGSETSLAAGAATIHSNGPPTLHR